MDKQIHVGSLSGSYRFGRFRVGTLLESSYSFIDQSRNFKRAHRVTPWIKFQQGRIGVTRLFYQYQDLSYFNDYRNSRPPFPEDALDRDGDRQRLGFKQYVRLPRRAGHLRFGADWDRLETEGVEYDYSGPSVWAGFGLRLPHGASFDGGYRHSWRDYDMKSVFQPGLAESTTDRIHRVAADLEFPLNQNAYLTFTAAYTNRNSDVELYDYSRLIFGSYLTYNF